MELTESLEKYLLAIYEIVKENKAAHVKDVSRHLSIGGPATSEAVKTLAERGYINYVPYSIITITDKGIQKAEQKITRHKTIANFLEKVLLVAKDEVDHSARKIEYSMSEDVLEKFVSFLSFMETCACKEPKWIRSCQYFASNGTVQEKCIDCISQKGACGCGCKG